jgi:hypothetical protein
VNRPDMRERHVLDGLPDLANDRLQGGYGPREAAVPGDLEGVPIEDTDPRSSPRLRAGSRRGWGRAA